MAFALRTHFLKVFVVGTNYVWLLWAMVFVDGSKPNPK
jgi:hypothetical protein